MTPRISDGAVEATVDPDHMVTAMRVGARMAVEVLRGAADGIHPPDDQVYDDIADLIEGLVDRTPDTDAMRQLLVTQAQQLNASAFCLYGRTGIETTSGVMRVAAEAMLTVASHLACRLGTTDGEEPR